MFTSSPTIDFEPPHLSRGVIPKVKGQGPRNLFASSRPRPSSRSPTPEAVEPSSWAVDQRPGHFNDNDDIYTEEVGPAPSSKEEGLRKDRAATEPLYNLSSSSSQSFRNSSTPVKALTMESSAFDVLSPTQLVTDTAIPPKRRRSEDPHDITEMHRARKCVRVEGAAANHAHEEFQFAYKLTQNSTSSKSSQTSSQTHLKATLFSDRLFSFHLVAPTTEELLSSMVQYSRFDGLRHRPMAQIRYQEPYYSTAAEVPHRLQEFAGAVFKISGKGPRWLSAFPHSSGLSREPGPKSSTDGEPFWLRVWEYALPPPSRRACIQWLETTEGSLNQPMPPRNRHRFSQVGCLLYLRLHSPNS